jgi:ureidoglycolate hydrolase
MKIKKLTHKNIKPYGWIIDREFIKDNGRGDKFGVLLKERSSGWRIGYLILRKKKFKKLENHPNSLETFEPVKGKAVIALSPNKRPHNMEIFLLDKPVVVKKRVWHDTAAVSKECEIKIFENIEVKTEHHYL